MPVRVESQAEPIPGYKLIARIGGGGFGEVWKAEAPGGLHKAIKFVYGDLQTAGDDGARAEQELKALSRVKTVRHPYILSLERYDIIDGQLIIVMELADRNLWDRFKECRNDGLPGIPRDELLRYMEESAEALDLMNVQYQLQHLDIKPHNLFLTHNHVKVADFGLVKDLEGMVASVTGGVTPVYAAPETFDGYVSRFCDQYSLAIVYQELLTGQRPFSGTNVRQLIIQHLQGVPNLQALPPADREPIAKALSKSPDDRHKSCMDLVRALRGQGTPDASTASQAPRDDAAVSELVSTPPPGDASPPNAEALAAVTERVRPDELAKASRVGLDAAQSVPKSERPSPVRRAQRQAPEAQLPAPQAEALAYDQTREAASDGVLAPALIIGLGHQGLTVLRQLREEVLSRFGSLETVPSLRLMYIDTDPDDVRDALRGLTGPPISPNEALLIRLSRPSHYLKMRDGREARKLLDGWFDNQMLYRIPRTQLTTGLRALGRLAFCDTYAAIARRLREELQACSAPQSLAAADRATGLGIRRYRPRVYVVTSLAGGTGSGMFLDLAYVVRHVLRELASGEPDVVGLCFVPAVQRNSAHVMAIGNTFAALTELSHFTESGHTFVARYEEKEAAIRDAAPPFNRCLILALGEEGDNAEALDSTKCASESLFRELFAQLGRAADQRRSELAPDRAARDPSFQTFGLYRFAFPRRELVRQVARQLCHRLVQRWMSKDSKPLQDPVRAWVQEQWTGQELGAECFIASLQEQLARVLGQAPESAFAALLEPLVAPADAAGAKGTPPTVAPEIAIDVLKMLEELLGRPEQEPLNQQPARIPEAVRDAAAALVEQWGEKLNALVTQLIEEPEYRLAGAEEAIRQIISRIERALETHEPIGKDLVTRASEARTRIFNLLRAIPTLPSPKARTAASKELLELMRNYPKWRCQALVLQEVSRSYVSLRGNLSDQLREVNFCRVRLGELMNAFAASEPARSAGVTGGRVRPLFPARCRTLEQAVDHFGQTVTPEEFQQLDQQVQTMIVQQFCALLHVCMTPANLLRNVQMAMEEEVAGAVERRIGRNDVADLFFEHFPHDEEAANEIASAFDESAPDLAGMKSGQHHSEVCVLAVPANPAGERIKALARQVLPEVAWSVATGPDDIVLYREAPQLHIADLAQLGPVAQEAYRQMTSIEHFTPHTRIDIAFVPERAAQ
jgi:serine/threonine protein kinase